MILKNSTLLSKTKHILTNKCRCTQNRWTRTCQEDARTQIFVQRGLQCFRKGSGCILIFSIYSTTKNKYFYPAEVWIWKNKKILKIHLQSSWWYLIAIIGDYLLLNMFHVSHEFEDVICICANTSSLDFCYS